MPRIFLSGDAMKKIQIVFNDLPISVAAILQHPDFCGRLVVSPVVAGQAINLAAQTTYNLLSFEKFPLPLVIDRRTGKKMVRVEDLLNYFCNLPAAPAKRRGAPLKRARLAGGGK